LFDPVGEFGYLVVERATFGHLLTDLPIRVHDGRVVASTEGLPDAWQRQVGQLAAQVHGDLACVDQHPRARVTAQVLEAYAEVVRRRRHDLVGGDVRAGTVRDEVAEHLFGQGECDRGAREAGERGDPDQGTLEFADGVRDS